MNKTQKTIQLIKTNKNDIQQLLVSEHFMLEMKKFSHLLSITIETKNDFSQYFLFGIPLVYSNILKDAAVLVMKNGENIILNNI